jgi:hypothetical protein
MKLRFTEDAVVNGVLLRAGDAAIVSDDVGEVFVVSGVAIALSEDERGGFAVPMQTEAE